MSGGYQSQLMGRHLNDMAGGTDGAITTLAPEMGRGESFNLSGTSEMKPLSSSSSFFTSLKYQEPALPAGLVPMLGDKAYLPKVCTVLSECNGESLGRASNYTEFNEGKSGCHNFRLL